VNRAQCRGLSRAIACVALAAWDGACVSLDDARAQFCAAHPNICSDGGTADAGPAADSGQTVDGGTADGGGRPDSGPGQDAGRLTDGGPQCIRVPLALYPAAMAADLAAGDLQGSGRPDVVVLEFFQEDARVFSNKGDGTFGPGTPIPWSVDGGGFPGRVVIGDFNRDGTLDVALTLGGTLFVSLNQGGGVLGPPARYDAGKSPGLVAGDFNGDGWLDLAIADETLSTVSVRLNAKDGGLLAAQTSNSPAVRPSGILAGSFDPNGRADVLATDFQTSVCSLLNDGSGLLTASPAISVTQPGWPAIADFDRDGKVDFVVNLGVNLGFQFYPGDGSGNFSAGGSQSTPFNLARPLAADLNGDGNVDLAFGINLPDGGGGIAVFLGHGDGTFDNGINVVETGTPISILKLVAADLNGNGTLDLVGMASFENQIVVALDPCPLPQNKTPACVPLGQPCQGTVPCCDRAACVAGSCP
jgi:hypothetical protein